MGPGAESMERFCLAVILRERRGVTRAVEALGTKVHRGWTEQTCGLQRAVNPGPSTRFAAQEARKYSDGRSSMIPKTCFVLR
jgi:hypothetical protein